MLKVDQGRKNLYVSTNYKRQEFILSVIGGIFWSSMWVHINATSLLCLYSIEYRHDKGIIFSNNAISKSLATSNKSVCHILELTRVSFIQMRCTNATIISVYYTRL
jgi:hypothetical protein